MPALRTSRIDGILTSTAIKPPCRVVSNANVPFTGSSPYGFLTINGKVVSDNADVQDGFPDRVLLKDQDDTTQNGIWEVSSTYWRRALDFDGTRDVVKGTLCTVFAADGQIALYQVTTNNPIIFGTSHIHFAAIVFFPDDGTFGLGDRTMDADTVSDVVTTDHAGDITVDGAAGSFDIIFQPNILPGMWVKFNRTDSSLNASTIRITGPGGSTFLLLTADGDWGILKSHSSGTLLKLICSGTKT